MPDVEDRVRESNTGDEDGRAQRLKKPRLTAAASTTLTARVPTTLAATFDAISLITGESVGAHVRVALEEYLVRNWSPERLATDLAAARQAQEAAKAERDALATAGLQEAVERVVVDS